jgi:hypothetical protein
VKEMSLATTQVHTLEVEGWAEQGELPAIQRASLHLYQLYDDGFAIDLERARGLITSLT